MKGKIETREIVEASIITGIMVMFAIAGLYIPFLSIFLFIIPTPLIVIGQRLGTRYALMSLVIGTLITLGISNPIIALYVITLPGMIGIGISIMINRRAEVSNIIIVGALVSIVTTIISINLASHLLGVSFIESIKDIFKQSFQIQQYFGEITNSSDEVVLQSQEMIKNIENLALNLIPTIIVLSSFFSSIINLKLATIILRRTGNPVIEIKPFKDFKLSRNTTIGLLVIILLSFITSKTNIVNGEMLMLNISFLYQIVFIVQGLAVVVYYLSWYKVPKIIALVLIPIILLSNLGVNAITMIGIMDVLLDLRKYKREEK